MSEENVGKTKAPSFLGNPTKCYICTKTVYRNEEIRAVGHVWHVSCFTCGGSNKDGCGRVLTRDKYLDHESEPYCPACYNKLFRPKGFGYGNTLSTDYGPSDASGSNPITEVENTITVGESVSAKIGLFNSSPSTSPVTIRPISGSKSSFVPLSPGRSPSLNSNMEDGVATRVDSVSPAATSPTIEKKGSGSFRMPNSSAPKCTVCAKTVYKMEEVSAVGRIWHTTCFTCGGGLADTPGCKRVLRRDGYLDHDSEPFCQACYSKLFKPKGFGFGASLSTDYSDPLATSPTVGKSRSNSINNNPNHSRSNSLSVPVIVISGGANTADNAVQNVIDAFQRHSVREEPKIDSNVASLGSNSASNASPAAVKSSPLLEKKGSGSFRMPNSSAPKCTVCAKTVYKMEEVSAVGRIWHTTCFTCGGGLADTPGCKRVLRRDNYVDHDLQPFCQPCYNKLYKPKGFGFGTLSTDYGPMAANTPSPKAVTPESSLPTPPTNTTDSCRPKREATYVGDNDEVAENEW
mmetsp:Transcript_7358/g.10958  ORF Transcript_7358/g.10958 Transcript_7358/m.10958 type:complete len:518 (-) Transcript_7358:204-1757(-)